MSEHHTATSEVRRRSKAGPVVVLLVALGGLGLWASTGDPADEAAVPTTAPASTTTTEPGPLVGFPRSVEPLSRVAPGFDRTISLVAVDTATERTEWWWFDADADRSDGLELELLERATLDVSGEWLAGRAIDPETGLHRLVVVGRDGEMFDLAREPSISRIVWDNETPGILWWAARDPSLLERVDMTVAIPFRSNLRLGRPLPQGPPVPDATADLDDDWKVVAGNTSAGGATLTITELGSDNEITVRAPGVSGPDAEVLDVVLLPT